MRLYTGSVSKSYTVSVAKSEALTIQYDGSTVNGNRISAPFTFASAGVTFGNSLAIIDRDGRTLGNGRDYKLTYSGNKKVNENAKCTITFLGNYKGHAKLDVTYINNINKGKATVTIKAVDNREGCKYTGCKKATFSIMERNLD